MSLLGRKLFEHLYKKDYTADNRKNIADINASFTPNTTAPYQQPVQQPETLVLAVDLSKPDRSNMEQMRNYRAMRLHRGIANDILKHPNAQALFFWLEAKPIYKSGVIVPDGEKMPYKRLAAFYGCSETCIRNYIRALKKLKLIEVMPNKAIRFVAYQQFADIFGGAFRKYKLKNNTREAKNTVRYVALCENLKRQDYRRINKATQLEFFNEHEYVFSRREQRTWKNDLNKYACPANADRSMWKKLRRVTVKNWDSIAAKHERTFLHLMQQRDEMVYLNPHLTLSCGGGAKLIGRGAKSTGHRWFKQMQESGVFKYTPSYLQIGERSQAIWEQRAGMRSDVFGFNYPQRGGGYKAGWFINRASIVQADISHVQF